MRITLKTSYEEVLSDLCQQYEQHVSVYCRRHIYIKSVNDELHDLVMQQTLGANGLTQSHNLIYTERPSFTEEITHQGPI